MRKPWGVEALVRQLVSFAGNDDRTNVSQLLIQYFVNYNLPDRWYLVLSQAITNNWEGVSGERWMLTLEVEEAGCSNSASYQSMPRRKLFTILSIRGLAPTGHFAFNFNS